MADKKNYGSTKGGWNSIKEDLKKSLKSEIGNLKGELRNEVKNEVRKDIAGIVVDEVTVGIDITPEVKGKLKENINKQIQEQIPTEVKTTVALDVEFKLPKLQGVELSDYVKLDQKELEKKVKALNDIIKKTGSDRAGKELVVALKVAELKGFKIDKKLYDQDFVDYTKQEFGNFVKEANSLLTKVDFSSLGKESEIEMTKAATSVKENVNQAINSIHQEFVEVKKDIAEYNKAISKMKKPAFHVGDLEKDPKYKADNLGDKTKPLNRLGSGTFWSTNLEDALTMLADENLIKEAKKNGRELKLYITDLANIIPDMVNIENDDDYEDYIQFLGKFNNFVVKAASMKKPEYKEAELDEIYEDGERFFKQYGIAREKLVDIVKDSLQYYKSQTGDKKYADDLSAFLQQKYFNKKGVYTGTASPLGLDNYNVGSVVFQRDSLGKVYAITKRNELEIETIKDLIRQSVLDKANNTSIDIDDISSWLENIKEIGIFSSDELENLFKEFSSSQATAPIVDSFKELVKLSKESGLSLEKYLDGIKKGSIDTTDSLKELLDTVGVLKDNKINYSSISEGTRHLDGFVSDEYTIIGRKMEYLAKTDALMPKLKELEDQGVKVGTIVGIIKDETNGLFYEIQKTQKGKIINSENLEFLEATEDEIKKLKQDLEVLQKAGVYVDTGGQNLLYEKGVGFSFIDLAVPKDLNDVPEYLQNSFEGIIGMFEEYLPQVYKKGEFLIDALYSEKLKNFANGNVNANIDTTTSQVDELGNEFKEVGQQGEEAINHVTDELKEANEETTLLSRSTEQVSEDIIQLADKVSNKIKSNVDEIANKIDSFYKNKIAQSPDHAEEYSQSYDAYMSLFNGNISGYKKDIARDLWVNFEEIFKQDVDWNATEKEFGTEFISEMFKSLINVLKRSLKSIPENEISENDWSSMLENAINKPLNQAIRNYIEKITEEGILSGNGEFTSQIKGRETFLKMFDLLELSGIPISSDVRFRKQFDSDEDVIQSINKTRVAIAQELEQAEQETEFAKKAAEEARLQKQQEEEELERQRKEEAERKKAEEEAELARIKAEEERLKLEEQRIEADRKRQQAEDEKKESRRKKNLSAFLEAEEAEQKKVEESKPTNPLFQTATDLKNLREIYHLLRNINHDIQLYEDPSNFIDTGIGKTFNAIGLKKTGNDYETLKEFKKEILELNPILNAVADSTKKIGDRSFTRMFGSEFGMDIPFVAKKAEDIKELGEMYHELVNVNQKLEIVNPDSHLAQRFQQYKDEILELNPLLSRFVNLTKEEPVDWNELVGDSFNKAKTEAQESARITMVEFRKMINQIDLTSASFDDLVALYNTFNSIDFDPNKKKDVEAFRTVGEKLTESFKVLGYELDNVSKEWVKIEGITPNGLKEVADAANDTRESVEKLDDTVSLSVSSPTQVFDNEIQQNLVMLENYENTIKEINKLSELGLDTNEAKKKLEELNKLADYFAAQITVIRSENGHFVNSSMMYFNGLPNTNLTTNYDWDAIKRFTQVAHERSGLSRDNVSKEFYGIEDELQRIENASEGLKNALTKDLSTSKKYVSRVKADLLGLVEMQEELSHTSQKSNPKDFALYNELFEKFAKRSPELLQFLDKLKTYEQATDFVKTDEWLDFLATLPKAHTYLETLGYDFERINSNENNISLGNQELLNSVQSEIRETENQFEDLGNGTKRVISDIGLSYEEFINKVKSDKTLEERFAIFDETGKVIDSFIGKIDRLNLPENINTTNASKVFHSHPSMNPLGGTLSDDDYLTWFDLFLSKGIGKQFELMWRGKSVNIDLSNVKSTLISDVVSSLINIAKIAGMQLEDANGNIPIPLSDIYNSLSNGLLKSFVLHNNGNVNTDIIDEYKNEQFGIDNLYRVLEDFSEFRKNNYKNDNAIDNKIEEYKKILLYLKEHTEYTYERVKKTLDYEKAIIRDTDSYGLNHNSMMMKNESAEYLGEMLADSYSKVIGSEINSQNFDPFNLSSDAEREYFEITGKYYDAIAEAMDYTIRQALKGEVSEKDFIKEVMTNIGGEIGSLDSDEILEGFVSIKDTVEDYIKELFNKYKVELPDTPQISDSIIDDSVTQEWVDAREQEEKELKKEAKALRSLDDSFTEEEIEKMKKGMRNFVRGAIRIQDLIQSFKVEEDVLYAAMKGELVSNKNNLSSDATTLPSQIDEITQAEDQMGDVAKEATDHATQGFNELSKSIDDNSNKVQQLRDKYSELLLKQKEFREEESKYLKQGTAIPEEIVDQNTEVSVELNRVRHELKGINSDKIVSELEEAVEATEIWYRRTHDINEVLADTGGFFANSLELAGSYFHYDNDSMIAATIDKAKMLTVDAAGQKWNELWDITYDLEEKVKELGIDPIGLQSHEQNVWRGNTKYIAQLAQALGYLGVEIQNVNDVGAYGKDRDLIGNIVQVFDASSVKQVYNITDAYKGLSDEIQELQEVTQVKFNLPLYSFGEKPDFRGHTEDEIRVYKALFEDELDEVDEFGKKIKGLAKKAVMLDPFERRGDFTKHITDLFNNLRIGKLTPDEFLSQYRNAIDSLEKAISQASNKTPDLFEGNSGQLSFIENLTEAEEKASTAAAELVDDLSRVKDQIDGQMSFDDLQRNDQIDYTVQSEEKLLPMVIESTDAIEKRNEKMRRMQAIQQAFMNAIGQSNEAKINRDITETLEQRRKEQEKLNDAKQEEIPTSLSSPTADVDIKAEESAKAVEKEAEAMTEVKEESKKASTSKREFAKANAEVLQSIKESLTGLGDEAELFKALNNIINKFSGKGSDERISTLANNIIKIKDALTGSINDNSFISALQKLSEQGENLKDLADVLKASRKQIESAKDIIDNSNELSQEDRDALVYQLSQSEEYEREQKRILAIEKEIEKARKEGQKQAEAYAKKQLDEQNALKNSITEYVDKLQEAINADNIAKRTGSGVSKDLANRWESLKAQLGNIDVTVDTSKAKEEFNKLKENIDIALSPKERKFEKVIPEEVITNLGSQIEDFGAKNTKLSKELRDRLEEVRKRYQMLLNSGASGNALERELKSISSEFNKIKADANAAGQAGKNFGHMMLDSLKSANARFIANYLSIQDMIRYARTAFETIHQLDTALVDLKKTTTMSNSELEDFYHNSSRIAKQMGVSSEEIINQASAWSRLGYNTKETSETMAELSSQFAKISPGTSVEDATDYLVSTMKAFDIDVTKVESDIMDSINRIGNTMATSNQEVGEMLKRSSAAMAAANNSLAETIALESAAVQITRNAETTGTAFRTISMRIRGYDEETEEVLEDYEELKGKIANLTKTAKTPGGISLFTDASKTEYKSTYQLLKEIAEIYHDLTDKDQAALLETLAGENSFARRYRNVSYRTHLIARTA